MHVCLVGRHVHTSIHVITYGRRRKCTYNRYILGNLPLSRE